MKPGDIIFCADDRFGHHHFYEVNGVFLGAEDHVGLVEIISLTEKPGSAYGKEMPREMLVPEPLLRHFTVYTPTITPAGRAALDANERKPDAP